MHTYFVLCVVLLPCLVYGAVLPTADPCVGVAGKSYVAPADALACMKSFPFNETLRQNVLATAARIMDSFTFENYYLNSPSPFQESTVDIRAGLAKINTTKYETDYDFNVALFDFVNQLNDGHTRWIPDCYTSYKNYLPAPIVSLEVGGVQQVLIAPNAVEVFYQLGPSFSNYLASIDFDWKRLAGAKVVEIEGQNPLNYVDFVAKTVSGNYLDHGIRVNSVFSSYSLLGTLYNQRIGDFAAPPIVKQTSITMKLVTVNSTAVETVTVPFVAHYAAGPFTDGTSYWANNCAAKSFTNGFDRKSSSLRTQPLEPAKASIIDLSRTNPIALVQTPTLPTVDQGWGIKAYVLDDRKTGVMFVGSFDSSFSDFQFHVNAAINKLKQGGATRLLIDLTNNPGGYVCLGLFLHRYLAGSASGYSGFVSTVRASPLAQKIVAADISRGVDKGYSFYTADNYASVNGTQMRASFNYIQPPLSFTVNNLQDPTSQRFHDTCEGTFPSTMPSTPPFALSQVAIIGNGNCASTCALFSTLMVEKHGTTVATFGGKPGEQMEYKGLAGNQVLEWVDFDSEIKTAGVKNDPLAPPDLMASGNFRHNWRTAWSYLDANTPIAYKSEPSKVRLNYTAETWSDPQALWTFAAKQIFG